MAKIITPDWVRLRMRGGLTPGEVAVLSRVVRKKTIPEVDLVSSWGMLTWAAEALDGLFKQKLVRRHEHEEISELVGRRGFPSKPGPWIAATAAEKTKMSKAVDIAFPPSGNWLLLNDVPLSYQPPDLLMQVIEYYSVRLGVINADGQSDLRPARVLKKHLFTRLSEILRAEREHEGEG